MLILLRRTERPVLARKRALRSTNSEGGARAHSAVGRFGGVAD